MPCVLKSSLLWIPWFFTMLISRTTLSLPPLSGSSSFPFSTVSALLSVYLLLNNLVLSESFIHHSDADMTNSTDPVLVLCFSKELHPSDSPTKNSNLYCSKNSSFFFCPVCTLHYHSLTQMESNLGVIFVEGWCLVLILDTKFSQSFSSHSMNNYQTYTIVLGLY